MSFISKSSSVVVCLLASNAFSEEASVQKITGDWVFDGYIGAVSFDAKEASKDTAGIGDQAFSLGGTANFHSSNWLTSLGLDVIFYDDKNEIHNLVERGGDVESESSTAEGVMLSAAFGPMWKLGEEGTLLYSQVGVSNMVISERSISYCSNCDEGDIDIDGGTFLSLGISKNLNSFAIGLNYKNYFGSDDIDSSLNVIFSSPF